MTVWRKRFAWWIPKATNTHSEYVIFIAFPRQQWLRERALVLRLYVHCHVVFVFMEGFSVIEIFCFICTCCQRGGGEGPHLQRYYAIFTGKQ